MKQSWLNTVFPIAALFSFRMLGLFMLIPVFTLYATRLSDATPVLIGIALGAYGLSQGLLQMPFGMLSDRFGRKPVITLGLALFIIGSLLGAVTTSIYGMIAARIVQGMGAIGSVLIALMADLTPDEQRTKAMAVIGATIGISFSLAMVISPSITHHFGLTGIFYLTAFLASIGVILLHRIIPSPRKEPFHLDSQLNPKLIKQVMSNSHLLRLNTSIFCQHYVLTATFFTLPLVLHQHIEEGHLHLQWHFYLLLMVLSFLAMLPFLTLAEKKRQIKPVFLASVVTTCVCQLVLAFAHQRWALLCIFMFLYFVAFNILEASLPSLVSRQAPTTSKGTAMGIYSSSQFLGIFTGGAIAGIVFQYGGNQGIFIVNFIIALIWSAVAFYLKPHAYQLTLILSYANATQDKETLSDRLSQLLGVNEVAVAESEQTVYLRIDKALYREGSAEKVINTKQPSVH